jgi:hypothetical protein
LRGAKLVGGGRTKNSAASYLQSSLASFTAETMHVGLVIDIDSGITPGELSVAVLRLLTYFSQVSVCTLCQRRSCSTVLFCVLYARFSHVLSGNPVQITFAFALCT